jgi:hypothetical protein
MSTTTPNPSRRTLLGGVAASAVLTRAALAATHSPDAKLLVLCKTEAAILTDLCRLNEATGAGDLSVQAELDRLGSQLHQVRDRILPIPAVTAEGPRAKARLLQGTVTLRFDETGPCDGSDFQDRLVWSFTADLLQGA